MKRISKKSLSSMGGHQNAKMTTDEWLTPPDLLNKLCMFDLDPCAATNQPWSTARCQITEDINGLLFDWDKKQKVWCNPPYGSKTGYWLKKCGEHGNAIALIFARTETKMFFDYVWDKADALFFIKGRLFFYDSNGIKAKHNSGAPSVLIAYGKNNAKMLETIDIEGKYICLKN